jgi:arsenic resistance protein ArsH
MCENLSAIEGLGVAGLSKEALESVREHERRPRILLLYGSAQADSHSRLLTLEAARLLRLFGAEARVFEFEGLPMTSDDVSLEHPKVQELRQLSLWSEGQVWCNPGTHGRLAGALKAQIDWLRMEVDGVRPTEGRALAVMQIDDGAKSFNVANAWVTFGRELKMMMFPTPITVGEEEKFDESGWVTPSANFNFFSRTMQVIVTFTALVSGR